MILIKKFPAPSDLETLKKEAEEHNIDYQIDFFYDYIL